jgi:uncharacterized delta-60 repeat protein
MVARSAVKKILATAIAAMAVTLIAPLAWAASPGELDPSFSDDGYVLLPEQQVAVEALASGKALAVASNWTVRRFKVGGPRDLAYGGGDGIVMPDFGADAQRVSNAAMQPDGKLVVVGTVIEGLSAKTAVARFTTAGALDPTFSGDGIRTMAAGEDGFIGSSVAAAPSGRVIIAGSTGVEPGTGPVTDQDAAVIALTSSGSRVGTFGGSDGIATVDVAGDRDQGEGVDVQPDGRIVVVTTSIRAADDMSLMGVVRFTHDGALDLTFSQDARVVITFRSDVEDWGGSAGSDVVVNPSTAEISVGGVVSYGSNDDFGYSFAVARLSGSGTVLRRWVTLPGGHFGTVRAIDLIGRDVIAVGEVRDSVADCCGWAVVRFGSIEYGNIVWLPDDYNSGAFDVSVVDAKAYVVGSVEATVNAQWRRGAIARFIV